MIRSEQERVRLESLKQLRQLGIDPYPAAAYPVDHHAAPLAKDFQEGLDVCLAGRILSRRIMGKASFAELQDATGKIQIYLNRDELCPGEDKTTYNTVFQEAPRPWRHHRSEGDHLHHPNRGAECAGQGDDGIEQVHPPTSLGEDR